MDSFTPSYLRLLENNELQIRVRKAAEKLSSCAVCAQNCRVNRQEGELGECRTGTVARISSYGPHLGEENPLRGWRGSGTIFFSRCNLHCQYCQNHDISQAESGYKVRAKDLAVIMLKLQKHGCHNINFVSPSHVVPQILEAVLIAAKSGLNLPLVYNTGGYDSLDTLKLLDGVVDIYMPDMKYSHADIARKYSKIPRYPQINRAAVLEMHSQVGDLTINDLGLAERGLLVRHLVLPNELAGTAEVVKLLSEEISQNTYLNIMRQYRPAYRANEYTQLNRPISQDEYSQAVGMAKAAGLNRLD